MFFIACQNNFSKYGKHFSVVFQLQKKEERISDSENCEKIKFSKELEFWRNEKKSITKSNFLSNCLKSFKYLIAINLVQGNFFLRKSAQYEIPGSVIKIIAGEKGKFRLSTNL